MRNLAKLTRLRPAAGALRAGLCAALCAGGLVAGAAAQEPFTPPRAEQYREVASWPDFTGVWNPDWSILFGEGGRRPAAQPVLTPAAQERFAAFQAQQAAEGVSQEEQIACRPPGMPNIMRLPYPIEFTYSPGRVNLFVETYTQYRRIYVDGRPLPEDPDELFNGTSVGRWDGNALMVETVGFSPLVNIAPGVGHGPQMKIVERFWMEAPDVMRVETTITDPDVLAEPLVQQLAFRKQPDWEIREYVCAENNRLVEDENGANIDLGLEEGEDPFGPAPTDEGDPFPPAGEE
jgi:hypothetical protein